VNGNSKVAEQEKLEQLQQIDLFKDIPRPILEKISAIVQFADYEENQIIMLEGDENIPVFIVLSGVVRVYRANTDGREQTLIDSTCYEVFNLPTAFANDHTSPASASAITPVRLILIDQAEFQKVTCENPEIAQAVLQNMANRLRHFVNLTYDLSLRDVRGRLAHFLLVQSQKEGLSSIHWTQEEIATHINSVRGVVNRILREFIKEGLVKIERNRIIILDSEMLESEAEL